LKIKRIVSNVETSDVEKASVFYHDILGLKLVMDHGWIRTYSSNSKMTVQVSFASEGGSGTPVPDVSIEAALTRVKKAGIPIEYGPKSESWGVRRFYVRDPFGKLIRKHIPGSMPRSYVSNTSAMCLEDSGWMKATSKNTRMDFTLDGGRFLLSSEIGKYLHVTASKKQWHT
jgi:hypothetical protein